jgi:glycosyltransferase involved in cell wall biosynthesis
LGQSPNKPEHLSESLSDLINDKQQLEKLSGKARKSVEQHFDINIQAKKLVEVYKKVANKG